MKSYVKVYAETSGLIGDVENVSLFFILSGRGQNDLDKKLSKVLNQIDKRLFTVYGSKHNGAVICEEVSTLEQAINEGYPVDRMEAVKVSNMRGHDARGNIYVMPVNKQLINTVNSL